MFTYSYSNNYTNVTYNITESLPFLRGGNYLMSNLFLEKQTEDSIRYSGFNIVTDVEYIFMITWY